MQVMHGGAGGLRKHGQRVIYKLADEAYEQKAQSRYCQQAYYCQRTAAGKRFEMVSHVAMF